MAWLGGNPLPNGCHTNIPEQVSGARVRSRCLEVPGRGVKEPLIFVRMVGWWEHWWRYSLQLIRQRRFPFCRASPRTKHFAAGPGLFCFLQEPRSEEGGECARHRNGDMKHISTHVTRKQCRVVPCFGPNSRNNTPRLRRCSGVGISRRPSSQQTDLHKATCQRAASPEVGPPAACKDAEDH